MNKNYYMYFLDFFNQSHKAFNVWHVFLNVGGKALAMRQAADSSPNQSTVVM